MYDRIVVPLDGSKLADEALAHAKPLARRLDVPIQIVRAIDPTEINRVGAFGLGLDHTAVDELILEEERDAAGFVDAQVDALKAEGFTATGVVLRGFAASAVIAAATEGDLIVMASHGRTGLRRLLLGSVAEEVLRQSGLPVLLIRHRAADGEP